jgi:hypothetical protein
VMKAEASNLWMKEEKPPKIITMMQIEIPSVGRGVSFGFRGLEMMIWGEGMGTYSNSIWL